MSQAGVRNAIPAIKFLIINNNIGTCVCMKMASERASGRFGRKYDIQPFG